MTTEKAEGGQVKDKQPVEVPWAQQTYQGWTADQRRDMLAFVLAEETEGHRKEQAATKRELRRAEEFQALSAEQREAAVAYLDDLEGVKEHFKELNVPDDEFEGIKDVAAIRHRGNRALAKQREQAKATETKAAPTAIEERLAAIEKRFQGGAPLSGEIVRTPTGGVGSTSALASYQEALRTGKRLPSSEEIDRATAEIMAR